MCGRLEIGFHLKRYGPYRVIVAVAVVVGGWCDMMGLLMGMAMGIVGGGGGGGGPLHACGLQSRFLNHISN